VKGKRLEATPVVTAEERSSMRTFLFLVFLLGFSIRIDLLSERILEDAGDVVADEDEESNTATNDGTVVDGEGKEVQRRTVVHGAFADVEREASDLLGEKDAKVVTKVSTDEAKADVSTKNESSAHSEDEASDDVDDELDVGPVVGALQEVLDGSEARLPHEHLVVEPVTSETDDEDDDAIHDAGGLVVATEEPREEVCLVLSASNDVPHERVEDHMGEHKRNEHVLQIHALLDLLKAHYVTELGTLHYLSYTQILRSRITEPHKRDEQRPSG